MCCLYTRCHLLVKLLVKLFTINISHDGSDITDIKKAEHHKGVMNSNSTSTARFI